MYVGESFCIFCVYNCGSKNEDAFNIDVKINGQLGKDTGQLKIAENITFSTDNWLLSIRDAHLEKMTKCGSQRSAPFYFLFNVSVTPKQKKRCKNNLNLQSFWAVYNGSILRHSVHLWTMTSFYCN